MSAANIESTSIMQDAPKPIDRLAKSLMLKWAEKLCHGHLEVHDGNEIYHFGEAKDKAKVIACIDVKQQRLYRDILLNGTIGVGESYMRGAWSSPELTKVIRVFCLNLSMLKQVNTGWASAGKIAAKLVHKFRANNKKNSRLNIAAHYDLGNDFFKLFLDETMMYSSAIFPDRDSSLFDASTYKLKHICDRLQLKPSDHLLEIGTGWGGMAIYAAKNYGCRVTTTTISKEQYEFACEQVKALGLEDKITLLLDDYRDLTQHKDGRLRQYDKLVSVEMIEAVGRKYYQQYFATCTSLLKPDGKMLIQAITMPDQRYETNKHSVDFIQRYIFPGGELPSMSSMMDNIKKYTDMNIVNIDDIGLHYANTLSCWKQRFFDRIDEVRSQGFDDVFIRMWDFYLSYCEGGFRERSISTVQLLLAKPECREIPEVT